ncbi:Methionine aminopeptidase [Mycena indigotica]|uniref:Methionine aminopeptidase n=1 Tax=Mycena indigotica TaxID=2126181 RepID=A0A8H6SAW4_9AGAR|nr:Methionine aminopeptidase [Mycena indigotica]KAF7294957.1 Methionine aminopeptidase [Mycena indigotica]
MTLCQNPDCPNGNPPSRLECPTCNKLGIKGSFFCGQDCFKSGWVGHKIIHNVASGVNPDGSYNPFPSFSFTGSMRPVYPLSPRRKVPEHIPVPDYVKDGVPRSEARAAAQTVQILNAEEIQKMRTVCRMSREILDIAAAAVRPGITTDEIDEIVHNATIERNAYPSPLNYRNFPKSVCTSVNEVICHGIPDQRKLQEGDIINLDISVFYDGYHGDVNATYPVGKIDDESAKLIATSRECLDKAIAMCKPGALIRDVGKVIEPIARTNGCSSVKTYTGHGIHTLFHTVPNVPHYAKNKAVGTMKAGMVFTIEPMINLGSNWSEVHWPDNWTATTVDGKRSAQFEETLLITETGVEVLTGPIN